MLLIPQCTNLNAECYTVENLKGYAANEDQNYKISKDSLGEKIFYVEIDGDNSSVKPSDINCIEISTHTITCVFSNGLRSTIESWNVNLDKQKAYYTQTRSGVSTVGLNNAKLFVGDIIGNCTK